MDASRSAMNWNTSLAPGFCEEDGRDDQGKLQLVLYVDRG